MTIAAGWDGRPGGFDALVLARVLAGALDADVTVVHVDTGEEPDRELASDLEQAFARSGIEPRTETISNESPADALEVFATDTAPALLAIGSTHQAGFGRVRPGAVGERLLGRISCPLAIAPQGFAEATPTMDGEEYARVVAVGFDNSASSHAALDFAAQIAGAVHATLRVIAVGQPLPHDLRGFPAGGPTPAVPAPDLQSHLHEAVTALADELRALPIHERGDPANVILEHADEGVDLLVIGSHSHGRFGHALLGSTAKLLVRAAPCPVIVMPAA